MFNIEVCLLGSPTTFYDVDTKTTLFEFKKMVMINYKFQSQNIYDIRLIYYNGHERFILGGPSRSFKRCRDEDTFVDSCGLDTKAHKPIVILAEYVYNNFNIDVIITNNTSRWSLNLNIQRKCTILNVKKLIEKKLLAIGISKPYSEQQLFFNSRLLDNENRQVWEYGIVDQSEIYLAFEIEIKYKNCVLSLISKSLKLNVSPDLTALSIKLAISMSLKRFFDVKKQRLKFGDYILKDNIELRAYGIFEKSVLKLKKI